MTVCVFVVALWFGVYVGWFVCAALVALWLRFDVCYCSVVVWVCLVV